ncbi:MAG TPA: substrate-binding domain-containing protein [Stellaceae bacterium]|nr:substrate-binding domain-containing protein [Stellaceae bacterium]
MQDLLWPAVAAFALLSTAPPRGAEITLTAPGGIRTALQRLIPLFEQASGHKVAASFMSGAAAKAKIAAGELVDVPVVQPPYDNVVASGNVLRESETPLATVSVVAAIAAARPAPDIATPEGLRRLLLETRSIACPSAARGAACGVSFAATLDKLGIADQVAPKMTAAPTGWESIKMLGRGEVELGITFASEIDPDPRVQLLGPLPRAVSTPTGFVAFLHARSSEREAASALIRFLASAEAAAIFKQCGMTPGK